MASAITIDASAERTVQIVKQVERPAMKVSNPTFRPHRTIVRANGALHTGSLSSTKPVHNLNRRIAVAKQAVSQKGASLNPHSIVTVRRDRPEPLQKVQYVRRSRSGKDKIVRRSTSARKYKNRKGKTTRRVKATGKTMTKKAIDRKVKSVMKKKELEDKKSAAPAVTPAPAAAPVPAIPAVSTTKTFQNPDGSIVTVLPGAKVVNETAATAGASTAKTEIDELVATFTKKLGKQAASFKQQLDQVSSPIGAPAINSVTPKVQEPVTTTSTLNKPEPVAAMQTSAWTITKPATISQALPE